MRSCLDTYNLSISLTQPDRKGEKNHLQTHEVEANVYGDDIFRTRLEKSRNFLWNLLKSLWLVQSVNIEMSGRENTSYVNFKKKKRQF